MHTILLVDDDDAILMLYGDELTEEGYDVITCRDGSELLKMIQEFTPDVVVLDIMLGDGNGLDLLQDIRNTHYDLPVILCSAYPVFKYEMKSLAADYYVVKGSCLDELKTKISMALQARIPRSATEDKGMPFWEEQSAGRELFQSRFSELGDTSAEIVFTGEKSTLLAPEGEL